MRLYSTPTRSALIYTLQTEIGQHENNLQRALDGKSAEFVPNSTQRTQIEDEQERLKEILHGITLLANQWRVTRPNPKPIRNLKKRDQMLGLALADTAIAIIRSGQNYAPRYKYSVDDLQALNYLFRYLNSKIYHLAKLPDEISDTDQYTTLHWIFGYNSPI